MGAGCFEPVFHAKVGYKRGATLGAIPSACANPASRQARHSTCPMVKLVCRDGFSGAI